MLLFKTLRCLISKIIYALIIITTLFVSYYFHKQYGLMKNHSINIRVEAILFYYNSVAHMF